MAQVYISLGSNINREHYVVQGLNALATEFGQLTLSSLFESESIGFDGAPFYNMVIALVTDKSIEQVVQSLRNIEFANGRTLDAKKFSPRTLDLDLLLFDDLILSTPAQIPRDEITKNAFVLWPLAEVAAAVEHPIEKLNYQQLWQNYNKSSQQLRKVPLNWKQSQE
ncbi:MAG: 2-amino-4-hydroxy-6-hydroxymethyldihydropteridine diphosphokinase [Colwellia sp.]|nr:2-amino-4-hydroxy-6-hydroxymethyldihydropteridine diphosphokinase [Colwellia sp.]